VESILLIHNGLIWGEELTFALEHSGFQVVCASGGQQALAELGRRHPDVIIMSESSHRLNGDELCVRLRQICQAPIIILGQDSEELSGIDLLEMGADAYLTSPLNLRELRARVRSLLRRTQANAKEFEGG
jgi:DNA-binding response OmpR family regulator